MPRQSDSFETYHYLDGGIIAGKWQLTHNPHRLDVSYIGPVQCDQRYQVIYTREKILQISLLEYGTDFKIDRLTGIPLTGEENTNAAKILLALTLFMLETGNLDPNDVADALAPRKPL